MLLIVPLPVHIFVGFLGFISISGIAYVFYRSILQPVFRIKADIESPPLKVGFTHVILIDDTNRTKRIGIGQMSSEIKTRLTGIKEDHLVLQIKKERTMEEYAIEVIPNGPVYCKSPHSQKMEQLKGNDIVESRELIGHPALFRLAALVKSGRVLQYLEFELSTNFIIDTFGRERMKFSLTLKQIFPSLNINSRNKKGIYSFGRVLTEQE
jgi:hypothetical protein